MFRPIFNIDQGEWYNIFIHNINIDNTSSNDQGYYSKIDYYKKIDDYKKILHEKYECQIKIDNVSYDNKKLVKINIENIPEFTNEFEKNRQLKLNKDNKSLDINNQNNKRKCQIDKHMSTIVKKQKTDIDEEFFDGLTLYYNIYPLLENQHLIDS